MERRTEGDIDGRGTRLRFVGIGASEDTGTPVVFVHDALASARTFFAAFACFENMALAAADRGAPRLRVIALDLPGFGASAKPDPRRFHYGWDAFADAVADLIAALGLGRVHVCGHGMGGGVAIALAARHSALVHKLVLVNALVYPSNPHAEPLAGKLAAVPFLGGLIWRQLMGRELFRRTLEATVYAGSATNVPSERQLTSFFEAFDDSAARQAAQATRIATADARRIVALLPRIAAETLVIWGRHDTYAPVEQGRKLARALRGRLEVFECGRCPPEEEPALFASALQSFLHLESSSPHRPGATSTASAR